jgi:signal transduction histidine kinase
MKKAAEASSRDELVSENIAFQSQLATNLSMFINDPRFVDYIKAGPATRLKYSGDVNEVFLNSIKPYKTVIAGIEIYQNQETGIRQFSHPNNKLIKKILGTSDYYFSIPLSYMNNQYDPNSQYVGYVNIYINKDEYIDFLVQHYGNLKKCIVSEKEKYDKCVSISGFGIKFGIFKIELHKHFYIRSLVSYPAETDLVYRYFLTGLFIFAALFFFIYVWLASMLTKRVFVPLGRLRKLLTNKQVPTSTHNEGLEEITVALASVAALKGTLEDRKNDFVNFRKVVLKQVYTDIHEVKNYFTSVISLSENITQGEGSELRLIKSAEKRVYDLLKKYRNFSLNEITQLREKPQLTSIKPLFRRIDDKIQEYVVGSKLVNLSSKKIEIDSYISIPENYNNHLLLVSRNNVITILDILYSNAAQSDCIGLKSIKISAYIDKYSFILKVTDNGVGFDSERIDQYFAGHTSKELGSGIGLSRCQEIIQPASGEIKLESNEPGENITVSVEIPILKPTFFDLTFFLIKSLKFNSVIIYSDREEYYFRPGDSVISKKIFTKPKKFKNYLFTYYFDLTTLVIIDSDKIDLSLLEEIKENKKIINENVYILSDNEDVPRDFTIFRKRYFEG